MDAKAYSLSGEDRGDGMSDIKDIIEIILVALACPLVLPVIIDEAEGSET